MATVVLPKVNASYNGGNRGGRGFFILCSIDKSFFIDKIVYVGIIGGIARGYIMTNMLPGIYFLRIRGVGYFGTVNSVI